MASSHFGSGSGGGSSRDSSSSSVGPTTISNEYFSGVFSCE